MTTYTRVDDEKYYGLVRKEDGEITCYFPHKNRICHSHYEYEFFYSSCEMHKDECKYYCSCYEYGKCSSEDGSRFYTCLYCDKNTICYFGGRKCNCNMDFV